MFDTLTYHGDLSMSRDVYPGPVFIFNSRSTWLYQLLQVIVVVDQQNQIFLGLEHYCATTIENNAEIVNLSKSNCELKIVWKRVQK